MQKDNKPRSLEELDEAFDQLLTIAEDMERRMNAVEKALVGVQNSVIGVLKRETAVLLDKQKELVEKAKKLGVDIHEEGKDGSD